MTAPAPAGGPAPERRDWSDPALARIADLARDEAGLVFSANRIPSAEQGIRRAMAAVGARDAGEFHRAALSPGRARDALLAELTVGESYFFREPAQLELLVRELLPAFAEQRRAQHPPPPLRVWSAACSNGEEPYSVAMLLREAAWPWGAEILGTDIALPRLVAARRARYSRWAFRATPRHTIDRWFEHAGDRWVLKSDIRDMVRFRPLNLVGDEHGEEAYPAGMDVVLCRNVLIYFAMETVARVAERLLASLAPEGWLLLGASDPPLTGLVACEAVTTSAGLAYRRADRPGRQASVERLVVDHLRVAPRDVPAPLVEPPRTLPPAPVAPVAPPAATPAPAPPSPPAGSVGERYAAGDHDAVVELARARIAAGRGDEHTRVLLVRALANRERLAEAGEACAAALDEFPFSPELHLLHATLLARAGRDAETVAAARRALYLDPELVMARIVLADALARTGDRPGALRALRAAADALAPLPATAPVTGADGETAGRLRQIVAFHRRALGEASA